MCDGPGMAVPGRDRPAERQRPSRRRVVGGWRGSLATSGTPRNCHSSAPTSAQPRSARRHQRRTGNLVVPRRVHGRPRGPFSGAQVSPAHGWAVEGVHIFCVQIGTGVVGGGVVHARGDGRPCACAKRDSLEARFSGATLAWDTAEAAEQGRPTELISRYEANDGILTSAGDAIALDLIREGGNRTGEAVVGLVFRRTGKDRVNVNSATYQATWAPDGRPGSARGRVVGGSAVDRVHGAGLSCGVRLIVVAEQSGALYPDGRSRHPDDRGYRRTRLPGPHHSAVHWGSKSKDNATQAKPDPWISLSIPVRSRFLRTRQLRRRSGILEAIYGARSGGFWSRGVRYAPAAFARAAYPRATCVTRGGRVVADSPDVSCLDS